MTPQRSWSALIVDDDPGVRQSLRLCLEAEDARVLGVGTAVAALEALERAWFDVVFLDLWLGKESGLSSIPDILAAQPGIGIIVVTAFASFESAVEAMRLGAADYLPKPFTPQQVRHAARRITTANVLRRRVSELEERIHATEGEIHFETASPVQRAFLEKAARAASSESVVLLRGESGTGKNVLARWMVAKSKREGRAFVTVHCPMLSAELMISALFGHRRGAFTGAVEDAIGKVEEAHGGTLFLDEIGDLTPEAQARLLRFLNDRTYERLGEAAERRADARIIAATNRGLEEEVATGAFREDLFFRLNVISLTLPALRSRREDILPLARHYLQFFERAQGRHGLSFSERCEEAILAHDWPGNLRELKNAVERAVILSPGPVLEPVDLRLSDSEGTARGARDGSEANSLLGADVSLDAVEREHIARVIARASSLEAAARILEIDPTTLQRKRKRYGLI
jgi:NtrC-family two-component system response regulator AlgB